MKEITNLRKKREKHFLNDDGTFTMYAYDSDVHYLKNGKYVEIDNTIIDKNNCLTNKDNDFFVNFAKNNSDDFLLKFGKDNNVIKIDLPKKNINKTINKNSITYNNILQDINIKYDIISNKVKDTIILNSVNNSIKKLKYQISTDLELRLNEFGLIEVLKNNEILFNIEKPTLNDKDFNSYDIKYKLVKKEEYYILSFIIEDSIVNNKELYPLIIDPTISTYEKSDGIYDTYIYPGDTNVDRNNQDILKVGVDSNNIPYRTLLKFDLPTIGTAFNVISAYAYLTSHKSDWVYAYDDSGHNVINVHAITENWNESNANWDTLNNKYEERIEEYFKGNRSIKYRDPNLSLDYPLSIKLQSSCIDITNLVKRWYSGFENNGMMLKASEEYFVDVIKEDIFYSKNNNAQIEDNISNPKPYLIINYRNQNGLEDYMSYQNIGFEKGKAYINNLTGNVTTQFELNKTIGSKTPIDLNLIYNTNDIVLNNSYGCGIGYKFNYYQTLKEVNYDNVCLEYLDADGTVHYFFEYKEFDYQGVQIGETKILDEDGLGLTATLKDNTYTIIDKNNNKMLFNKSGDIYYLTKIINTNEDSIIIEYNNDNKIIKITDADNESINITYENNKIVIIGTYLTTTINLLNNKITSINNKFGTINFSYNTNNVLNLITDINGKKNQFDYYETIPYRLKKVTEIGLNNNVGTTLEFVYEFNITRVKDNKGRLNSYTFNNQGNTIGITNLKQDGDFSNSYGIHNKYIEENNRQKNKLEVETSPTRYTKNYFSDSSFERGTYPANMITTEYARTGTHSLKLTNSYGFSIPTLTEGGTYTFSGYFKTDEEAELVISYILPNSRVIELAKTTIYPSQDFERASVTFGVDDEWSLSGYYIDIISGAGDLLYIDDIQLEKSETANYYNIIENSDFSNEMNYWTYDMGAGSEWSITSLNGNQKALKIKCPSEASSSIVQNLSVKGKAYDTYRLSFWYKNEGVKDSSNDTDFGNFAILGFSYPNNEETGGCVMKYMLNKHATEWQFFQAEFIAEEDYEGAWLSFVSQNDVNNLYITNITLAKDLESNSYGYDEEGNLISAYNQNKGVSKFKYDKNNQLIGMFEPKGNNFKFEYDNTDTSKVLQGISTKGIANQIKYNENNKPIKTIIKNVEFDEEKIQDNYYFIRLKSTEKYLFGDFSTLLPQLKEISCSTDSWQFIKENDYYIINSGIIPFYLTLGENNQIKLSRIKDESLKFTLEKNDNGSFTIKQYNTEKCITYKDNVLKLDNINHEHPESQQFYLENAKYSKYIETESIYTEDGKFVQKTIDSLGKVTNYDIDLTTGLVNSITDPKGQIINYMYNDNEQITKVSKSNIDTNYTYNAQKILSKIICNNKEYSFNSDDFLNQKQVKINNIILVENKYEENNGNLLSVNYGNNTNIKYTYDELDRVKTILKNNKLYTHYYNNVNELAKVETLGESYQYYYDFAERLSKYELIINTFKLDDNDRDIKINQSIDYDYDLNNNITYKKYKRDDLIKELNYTYDEDDSIVKVTFDGNSLNYDYDELGRLKSKNINNNLPIEYEYHCNGNKTSMILKSIKIENDLYEYIYDDVYNITHIYKNKELLHEYKYDDFNELIQDDNYIQNKTYKYIYDESGNVLTKKEYELNTENLINQDTFEYNNMNWKDQLTKANDTSITYDEIGNPVTIGDTILTWYARELQSYQNNSLNISYKYDKNGIRTKKIVNNIETNYFVENSNIIFEETNGNVIYYIRDDDNNLIGFTYNNQTYYYKKNYQNDIIGIYNSNYELIVTYEYDAWGKILSIKDSTGNEITDETHIAYINPFRYRSYYYDKETEMYYLNSRYYNPEWGRFLNADGVIGTSDEYLGYNLYAYCNNNPIASIDNTGLFYKKIGAFIKKTVKSAVQYVTKKVSSYIGKNTNLPLSSSMMNSALSGTALSNTTRRNLTNSIKNSKEMKNEINKCISSNINKSTFTCSGSVNGDYGFIDNLDLKLSVGHANFNITGVQNQINGTYNLKIFISDTYDFTERREWNSMGNIANNVGYYYQKADLLTPYKWDISYDFIVPGKK